MTATSLAQCITYDILVNILHYAADSYPVDYYAYSFTSALEFERKLLAPMAVCRLWRAAACPMFYRQAGVFQEINSKNSTTLNDSVRYSFAEETDHHRKLLVSLDVDTFLLPPTHQLSPVSILRFWKPIHPVLQLDIRLWNRDYRQIDSNNILNISKNINAFAKYIYTVVPNACRVKILSPTHLLDNDDTEGPMKLISKECGAFLRQSTYYLYLEKLTLTSVVFDYPGMTVLRYINIDSCRNQQAITELVHRNRQCLERLHFRDLGCNTLEWLVFGGNQDNNVCIFSQLKHLCAEWEGDFTPNYSSKLPLNPFPNLKTLTCQMKAETSLSGVLLACRSHIRHLSIRFSVNLWIACERLNVFAPGTFGRLHFMSIFMPIMPANVVRNPAALNNFLKVARATIECSLGLQKLILRDFCSKNIGKAFHRLRFPPTLRSLNLISEALSVAEAFMTFRSCPQLEMASITLDYGIDGIPYAFAWDDCILALRKHHQNIGSNLYSLGLLVTTNSYAYNTARILMLFAELLTDIRRVYIPMPDVEDVYEEINHVLERPDSSSSGFQGYVDNMIEGHGQWLFALGNLILGVRDGFALD
ncbi:hypothetical protein COEREDRAFT_8481 [Coemansia reversa NRRL 1564]|uniref:F-box domain-containing protein n=1 Tax=Coemansia reversa (strain ATCC 12441 / NRRL 1564) TaxID=763665 RepID=A0A2G5BBG6_COERN|nr:hypothetical protein COEREDRAFT_8481 [Coemansia reversa NRRL 1564]|eukprot:PIA16355.1 hypothetical protein COEREDRAFT_8481 [Coemansia reversa NRRL 1564]